MKRYIEKFFGIDLLKSEIYDLKDQIRILVDRNKTLEDQINGFYRMIEVGVDVHHGPNGGSWAVVCLQGKKDYVKFIHLKDSDIREIGMFIKRFERNNMAIDTPYGMSKEFILREFI